MKKILKFKKFTAAALALSIIGLGLTYTINTQINGSKEISLASFSTKDAGKAAVMAASCYFDAPGFWAVANGSYNGAAPDGVALRGQADANTPPQPQCGATCPAGTTLGPRGTCPPTPTCPNGAINPPTCDQFPICPNGANNPPNGVRVAPFCTTCPTGYYLNPNSRTCVPNPCGNTIPPANYGAQCNSGTNACGQSTSGTITCQGTCSATVSNNDGCITNFRVTSQSVSPNGSVEFSWNVKDPNSGVKCSFYDRARPQAGSDRGTPIPGLQDLDGAIDKIRINNIQRSTEFCLYCAYPNFAVPAASHQWVRVIRIGEN